MSAGIVGTDFDRTVAEHVGLGFGDSLLRVVGLGLKFDVVFRVLELRSPSYSGKTSRRARNGAAVGGHP
jgi:hypothetical protein